MPFVKQSFHEFLNFLFPPLCLSCKGDVQGRLFCADCWRLLAPPDPAQRCRHCFEMEEEELCSDCRKEPFLCFPQIRLFEPSPPAFILRERMKEEGIAQAIAAMAFVFWHRFSFPLPDALVEIPHSKGTAIFSPAAKAFAKLMQIPLIRPLKRTYEGFLKPTLRLKEGAVETDQNLLLLNGGNPRGWLKKAGDEMAESFPSEGLIFSFF